VELELTLRSGDVRTVLASLQYLNVDGTEALLSTFIDITGRVRAERQIRALAVNLSAAEQKERKRISQMLHDDLQQRLFSIKMQLNFLQDAYQQGNSAGIQTDINKLESWLSDAIDTTRHLSIELSPVTLQGRSFADSISWLVQEMRERYGLDSTLDVKGELPSLEEHLRTLLYECMRELMFNIVKHGDVNKADVILEQVDSRLRVSLNDHGKGFDAEAIMSDPKMAHGLLDVRNRLHLLGCTMQVTSRPGDGTQVTIEVPV
jgi:signal transduction histidine kinase